MREHSTEVFGMLLAAWLGAAFGLFAVGWATASGANPLQLHYIPDTGPAADMQWVLGTPGIGDGHRPGPTRGEPAAAAAAATTTLANRLPPFLCISSDSSPLAGAAVLRAPCGSPGLASRWVVEAVGPSSRHQIRLAHAPSPPDVDLCIQATANGVDSGSRIQLGACGAAGAAFFYDAARFTLSQGSGPAAPTGMCIDGFKVDPVAAAPCASGSPLARHPICDHTLAAGARVADLLGRLTDAEAGSLLGNRAAAVPRLLIPAYQWWNEATHGVGVS